MDIQTLWSNAGQSALVETQEIQVWTGREGHNFIGSVQLSSATQDAGNSPVTTLRAGLILGRITSSGLYKQWSPSATDGTQVARCVLLTGLSTLDATGTVAQKEAPVLLKGTLLASNLLLLDATARKQLIQSGRYTFSDDLPGAYGSGGLHVGEVVCAGPTQTVTTAHVGMLLVATGACAFTLPAIAAGLGPFEFLNTADANVSVASAEGDNMVVDGDASADSVAFSTASHKIGGRIQVCANAAGDKWYIRSFSNNGVTETIAT